MPLLLLPPLLLSTTCDGRACTEDTLQLHLLQWRPSGQLKRAAQALGLHLSDHAEAAGIDSASATLTLTYSPCTSTKYPSPSMYFDTEASTRGSCSL